jgi:F-box and WD-40 domain protein 1/11
MEAFRESAALNPNKIDEGYSEETRSQTESDAIMRTDERMGDSAMDQDAEYPLPDWVLNMNEAERGGKFISTDAR